MPDALATLETLGRAMVELRPVAARYDGLERRFCPHAIGRRDGRLRVFAWQFGGETHAGDDGLPNWRCFDLARLQGVRVEAGPWRRGAVTKGHAQQCLEVIEAAVAPEHTSAALDASAGDG